jgi:hypothetical protein
LTRFGLLISSSSFKTLISVEISALSSFLTLSITASILSGLIKGSSP